MLDELSRRQFLAGGLLTLLAPGAVAEALAQSPLRLGVVTDIHFAKAPARGTRFYEESYAKLQEACAHFRDTNAQCVISLGDIVDSAPGADAAGEAKFLESINKVLTTGAPQTAYTFGNHCVGSIRKEDYLKTVGQERGTRSLDLGAWHVVILDACYKRDGSSYEPGKFTWDDTTIPEGQIEWLKADLKASSKHTIVFCHQRLDWTTAKRPDTGVDSAPAVRKVLEESGKVRAVFLGHTHQNDYSEINGIPYVTLRAMVEGSGAANSGYSDLLAYDDGTLLLRGYREQLSRKVRI